MADSKTEWFWSRVEHGDPDDCWPWKLGRQVPCGYGQLRDGPKKLRAHRVAYELAYGPIPEGLCVIHSRKSCLPHCCNPTHLSLGTRVDVARNREQKGRGGGWGHGEANPRTRLSSGQVDRIRDLATAGQSYALIARQFGVYSGHVGKIVRGERRWING